MRGRGYAPKGQTPVLRINNRRESLSVISTVTNKGEMRWKVFFGALNAKILIGFLTRLIRQCDHKIFLILDNLRVHRSKLAAQAEVGKRSSKLSVIPAILTASLRVLRP